VLERNTDILEVLVRQMGSTETSISFSAKRCAYCPRPNAWSQCAIDCNAATYCFGAVLPAVGNAFGLRSHCALRRGEGRRPPMAHRRAERSGIFWSWVAQNIRPIVGWGIPVFIISAGIALSNRYKEKIFARHLAFATTIVLWPTVLIAWLFWLAPPMTGTYVEYLNALKSNAGVGAAIFVAVTPWLVVILKALGLDPLASGAKEGSELVKSFETKS
jgi:hypothetical protein